MQTLENFWTVTQSDLQFYFSGLEVRCNLQIVINKEKDRLQLGF